MRLQVVILGCALALGGCSGGSAKSCSTTVAGDPACAVLISSYNLQPSAAWQTPDAPVAVGASIDVAFSEQRCAFSSNPRVTLPGSGCGAWYPAPQLAASTLPMPDGSPCPIATTAVATGTLRFTRTAPGDPRFRAGRAGLPGYCAMDVTDPARGDATVIVL